MGQTEISADDESGYKAENGLPECIDNEGYVKTTTLEMLRDKFWHIDAMGEHFPSTDTKDLQDI